MTSTHLHRSGIAPATPGAATRTSKSTTGRLREMDAGFSAGISAFVDLHRRLSRTHRGPPRANPVRELNRNQRRIENLPKAKGEGVEQKNSKLRRGPNK
ncbi:unnamed protein product [Lampetra planeri]